MKFYGFINLFNSYTKSHNVHHPERRFNDIQLCFYMVKNNTKAELTRPASFHLSLSQSILSTSSIKAKAYSQQALQKQKRPLTTTFILYLFSNRSISLLTLFADK